MGRLGLLTYIFLPISISGTHIEALGPFNKGDIAPLTSFLCWSICSLLPNEDVYSAKRIEESWLELYGETIYVRYCCCY